MNLIIIILFYPYILGDIKKIEISWLIFLKQLPNIKSIARPVKKASVGLWYKFLTAWSTVLRRGFLSTFVDKYIPATTDSVGKSH